MRKIATVVAVLFCLGLSHGARAGGGIPPSFNLGFALASIDVNVPGNQTTVTGTFTANVSAPANPDAMLTATFTNSDGFSSPGPIGPFNPTISPGVCTVSFKCTITGLDFTMTGIGFGPTTFMTTATLADGFGSVIHMASFQASTPEPGALALLSLGVVALGIVHRRVRRRKQG
jgi:hypothetical protein